MTNHVTQKGNMVEEHNTKEPSPQEATPGPTKGEADQEREAKTDHNPYRKVVVVLPHHQEMSLQVEDVLEAPVESILVKEPTHVGPEDPLSNIMWIPLPVHKPMMIGVVGGPLQRRVLYSRSSKKEVEDL